MQDVLDDAVFVRAVSVSGVHRDHAASGTLSLLREYSEELSPAHVESTAVEPGLHTPGERLESLVQPTRRRLPGRERAVIGENDTAPTDVATYDDDHKAGIRDIRCSNSERRFCSSHHSARSYTPLDHRLTFLVTATRALYTRRTSSAAGRRYR
ncbi:hypothetical protein IM697_21685 [Streptomyces ferrugineus]|uniref:Uncharacterized protein n=1 Tax=Streptomyces ferrugineus TaxID=1413221 RepID=A0A7M2SZT9_9ACTN|nr:hypothetical protein IM697_21685 [Streptomyces ferrugineus]